MVFHFASSSTSPPGVALLRFRALQGCGRRAVPVHEPGSNCSFASIESGPLLKNAKISAAHDHAAETFVQEIPREQKIGRINRRRRTKWRRKYRIHNSPNCCANGSA